MSIPMMYTLSETRWATPWGIRKYVKKLQGVYEEFTQVEISFKVVGIFKYEVLTVVRD